MRRFLCAMRPYFRQVAGELLVGSLAGIIMNTAVVLPAILLGRAIDTALAAARGQADANAVTLAALAYIGGTLLTEVPRVFKRWYLITAGGRMRANMRADLLRGVLAWPMARLHQTPVGDLMARISGDVETLGLGVRRFIIELWDTILFTLSFVVAMLWYDAGLTVLVLPTTPLAMLLAYASGRWVRGRTTKARQANAVYTAALQEQLAGLRVVRLFGRAATAIAQITQLSRRQAEAYLATERLAAGLQPFYIILMMAGVVLLVWQGGERVLSGAMSVGGFVAYLELYLRAVTRGFREMPVLINQVQASAAAYARIEGMLAPALSMKGEPRNASFFPSHIVGLRAPDGIALHGDSAPGPVAARLRHVTFRYPAAQEAALQDVCLAIPAGALVAVTGPVGSGKSALVRALLGLYPLESGCVEFDRSEPRVGYLSQEPFLFSGTIRENILFGARTEAGLEQTVKLSALQSDLPLFAAGLDTPIGEMGVRISGGQRQRVALARAIAAFAPLAPSLLVLDDPFSAVDVDTESQIIAGLREAFGPGAAPERRATIVLCSHRLAAFPRADCVVVLAGGRIEESGTHAELMRAGGLYARIYDAQQRIEARA